MLRYPCVLICLSLCWVPAQAKVGHVIHLSVDGLRGDLLETLIESSPTLYPNFLRFVHEGATTFNARTDVFSTETLPNHATILTGRPVARPTGAPATIHHGLMDNVDSGITGTLHNLGNPNLPYIASTFDVVHDHGLSTAFYAEKDKFIIFDRSYDAINGAIDLTGVDDGRDKIDLFTFAVLDLDPFLASLSTQNFSYSFLHFTYTDGVGHNAGWGSPSWNAAVQYIDASLGQIMAIVESDSELTNDTVIILTADHGGDGTGHGSPTDETHYRIPLLVWGKGVAEEVDLYNLNATTRSDPGSTQPSYTTFLQPIRNGDTANLALHLLGLPPVPGSSINANQDLLISEVPEPSAFVLTGLSILWGIMHRKR